jgi:cephalosporin-C deacetylase
MPLFDLPLDELRSYRPDEAEPADFDAFWARTLQETRAHPLDARFEPQPDTGFALVQVDDVTFNGYGGDAIKGWFLRPAQADRPLPCVVTYIGYGGGRSLPVDHLAPAVAGLANLVMDTRGQGAGWSSGDTPDSSGAGPSYPGFLTRGIESPDTYYYRRVFADAVRAVEAAASHPAVDPERIGVAGGSQGGGIAIAAAALVGDPVRAIAADVPFLCHYRRATEITDSLPYAEITRYLKCHRTRSRQVFETLAYFDGVHFAPRITARALFSVALMDMVCPPSTVFAAYNRVRAEKDIHVYEFNEHEGGGPFHLVERLQFLTTHLGSR